MSESTELVLAARNVSKIFGGTRALDDVTLTLLRGEVHGLLGENGSGKSTLIKILAGFHAPEPGSRLEVDGRDVDLPLAPGEFRELGISFVHQDLGLLSGVSVLENLRIGEFATRRRSRISWRAERRSAVEAFQRFGIHVPLDAMVDSVRPVERALVAIVRAMESMRETPGGVLVLDEPTVFLPRDETSHLFAIVREIVARGATVLFVSHDLDEVKEVTDRVTVLRNGRVTAVEPTRDVPKARLVELIIGRRLEDFTSHQPVAASRPVLAAVAGLNGDMVRDVSFDVHQGEVLGLTGLVGSGFEKITQLMFGARRATSGTLRFAGAQFDAPDLNPHVAQRHGMVLVPADRQAEGSIGSLSVADNLTLPILERFTSGGRLSRRRLRREAADVVSQFDVRPDDPDLRYDSLSGGNQQKVLLAKWLQTDPQLLLLEEPTQGVDVGARQQILALVRTAADRGMGVVCASSDYEQLAQLCDRVLVCGDGRIHSELSGEHISKERIAERCYQTAATSEQVGEPAA